MKLLLYADLQATDGDERCFTDPSKSLQYYRVQKFFQQLRALYTQHKCDGLVDLGDTTDDRSSIPVPIIDVLMDGLQSFDGTNLKIIGNHEQYLRDTSIDVGRMFQGCFYVAHHFEVVTVGETAVFLVSYPESHEKLLALLQHELANYRGQRKVLFGHFQAVGAAMNSGVALMGIPQEILNQFDLCLLGHIHLPQSLGRRIHYVGSPFQQDWGEAGEVKRVALLDLPSLELTWLPLEGFPQYREAPLAKFKELFDPASEDRWRVVLRNHAETEEYFAFPHSNRSEAVYAYDTTEVVVAQGTAAIPQEDWSTSGLLRRYLQKNPPGDLGIEIEQAELLEVAESIVRGD